MATFLISQSEIKNGPHLQKIGVHNSVVTNLHQSFPVREVSSDVQLIREVNLENTLSFTLHRPKRKMRQNK